MNILGSLQLLAQSGELYVDGTFQIAPRLFYQMFTIHTFKRGQQFPLVYCLLPPKCTTKCITFVHIVDKMGVDIRPTAQN